MSDSTDLRPGTEGGTAGAEEPRTAGTTMDARTRLVRSLLRLILAAALLSAPVYLVAEEFGGEAIVRVLLSNGVCALGCWGLLRLVGAGRVELAARVLVWGLLLLVAGLASSNGEPVHVNVINFMLVTLLAAVTLGARALLVAGGLSAAVMLGIAWTQAVPPIGEDLLEARLEAIAQFLPTWCVVVAVLWHHLRGATERS